MNEKTSININRWILRLVIGILVLAGAIVLKRALKPELAAKPPEPVYVSVKEVKKGRAVEQVWFSGRIEPYHDVMAAMETGGRLLEIPVDVGADVKKDDLLLKIDDALPAAVLAQAQAQWKDAKRDFVRVEPLKEAGAVSDSVFDAARTRMEIAEAAFDQAKAMLDKCTLTSPIDGRIEERYVERGEYAKDGDMAFRIADLSKAKVVVYIPESDITDITESSEMKFVVGAYPDETFTGKVTFAADAADAMNHAFRVELLADNRGGKLKGGMIVNILLRRETKTPVVEIPFAAVLPRKGEHIVFTWENGHAVRRTVRIHSLAGENALISSGLEDGEMLIVAGQRSLQDGKRVVASVANTE